MFCRDVVLTCSLALLVVGCSAVGGPPINVGGGGSDKGGTLSGSGSGAVSGAGATSASAVTPLGGAKPIPLSVAGNSNTGGTTGAGGDTGSVPSDTDNCGSQTQNTKHQLVDIILVLDRSGSMLYNISEDCYCNQAAGSPVCKNTTSCSTRWANVSSGIESAVSSTPFLQWGLKVYSTPNIAECGVSKEMEVAIPDGTASNIRDKITSITPSGYTPTAAAITAAADYLKSLADGNPKVILLATDGEPNCAGTGRNLSTQDVNGTKTAIQKAFQASIKTYVIGIGPSTGNLDDFAAAGNTGKHYPATSPKDLNDALNAIGADAVSCSFSLTDIPADMTNTAVYVNKDLVEKDDPNGWTFGPDGKTIELTGTTCDKVKSERTATVQVLFGCKVPPRRID
jgi:Mg-chelatase subunit ChlD